MPNVLVLGSGMVSRPMVRHLLAQPSYRVTVGDLELKRVQAVVDNHPQGKAIMLDANDINAVAAEAAKADVVVSILPFAFHPSIAKVCLDLNRNFFTASYSKSIQPMDAEVKSKGLVFLTEMGLDPGIDHMSAMRIIDSVHANGGQIRTFLSYCGGLPSPEANTNPFGYKFSWSPKGVFTATRNDATFLKDGLIVNIPNGQLFQNPVRNEFEGVGILEGYPNRDSLEFIDAYGIKEEAQTMIRGTYRYPGWCAFWDKVLKVGILSETQLGDEVISAADFTASLIGETSPSLEEAFARKIGVEIDSEIMRMAAWLGLFSSEELPSSLKTSIDALTHLASGKMQFTSGERDMSVMHHVFDAEYPGRRERITSTLIDYGIPFGDSSMSRTVGLTAAIGVKLILEGRVQGRGILRPTTPDIYEPALAELESLGIAMKEETKTI